MKLCVALLKGVLLLPQGLELLQDSGEDPGSHCVAHMVYHSLYSPD